MQTFIVYSRKAHQILAFIAERLLPLMILFPSTLKRVTVSWPTDTNIYASGDSIGVGSFLTNAVPNVGGQALLTKLVVTDKIKQNVHLAVVFFSVALATAPTDNAAFAPTDAEVAANCLGLVDIPSAGYVSFSVNSINTIIPAPAFPIKAAGHRGIYAYLVSYGTPTYTGAADLSLDFTFEQQ